jgi:hypothetical protein
MASALRKNAFASSQSVSVRFFASSYRCCGSSRFDDAGALSPRRAVAPPRRAIDGDGDGADNDATASSIAAFSSGEAASVSNNDNDNDTMIDCDD